jgi:hypothetical protein
MIATAMTFSILNAKRTNPGLRAIAIVNDRDMVEAPTTSGPTPCWRRILSRC